MKSLQVRLKIVFYFLITAFVSTATFANNHHLLANSQTTISQESDKSQKIQKKEDISKKLLASQAHFPCSTHGHGHCCTHITNDFENEYSVNLDDRQKNDFLPKQLHFIQFLHESLRPPIAPSLIS